MEGEHLVVGGNEEGRPNPIHASRHSIRRSSHSQPTRRIREDIAEPLVDLEEEVIGGGTGVSVDVLEDGLEAAGDLDPEE
jgi:hypothetical protein